MSKKGKRIGFVDYRLNNFHANVFIKALRGPLAARGYTVAGCWGSDAEDAKAWAGANNVPLFSTPTELNEHVDSYMVLAPSNPELHWDLCRRFLPFGKITYVDKTFAQNLATARKIFALADKHRVALQTSSALRYTSVQAAAQEAGLANVRHMVAWGNGGSFGEYAIHPTELVISCMGPKVTSLMRRGTGDQSQLLLNFSDGRTAVINVYVNSDTAFAASLTTDKATRHILPDLGTLFVDLAAAILDFFDKGKAVIDRKESLIIRRILDKAGDPKALRGFVRL
jgi:predicted dehydrogenase